MNNDKNVFRTLSRKITINLSRQHEFMQQFEVLRNHNQMLQSQVEQLMKEVKALTDENTDLKEILYALNQENELFRRAAEQRKS